MTLMFSSLSKEIQGILMSLIHQPSPNYGQWFEITHKCAFDESTGTTRKSGMLVNHIACIACLNPLFTPIWQMKGLQC
jgi:hypothetical protein